MTLRSVEKLIEDANKRVQEEEAKYAERMAGAVERAAAEGVVIRVVRHLVLWFHSETQQGPCDFKPDTSDEPGCGGWMLFFGESDRERGTRYHHYGNMVDILERIYPEGGHKNIFVGAVDKRLGVIREWMKTSPVALYIQATANGEWGLLIKDHGQGGEGERWLHKWPTMEEFLVGVEEIIKKEKQNAAR